MKDLGLFFSHILLLQRLKGNNTVTNSLIFFLSSLLILLVSQWRFLV